MCYFFFNFTSYIDLYISTCSLASACQFLFKILIVITLFFIWLHSTACGIFVPWPGIELSNESPESLVLQGIPSWDYFIFIDQQEEISVLTMFADFSTYGITRDFNLT